MKILIIKLGAKGDVVRTLPILLALRQKHPDSEIHWITKPESVELLQTSPFIDKVHPIPYAGDEKFDVLYNFDIDNDAATLAQTIEADKKYGFYEDGGYASSFNFPAEYYLNTLFDDETKKSNEKSYQQMMFDAAELPYNQEHHPIFLTDNENKFGEDFLNKNNINKEKLIGIHLGASSRWPSKVWHPDNLKEFIKKANDKGHEILLFGGPNEIDYHNEIADELENNNINIFRNNPQNTDKEFFSLVNLCNKMICSDSFALHIALALKKPTIGLFFCTPPNEVEDYNLLKKITSPKLLDFFPEKMDQYDEDLVKSISPDEVLDALDED